VYANRRRAGKPNRRPEDATPMPTAEQLLARLYAVRKDFADDPEDETYQALHHAFLFISYNIAGFKKYVEEEAAKDN
jgi:hypothetical protein